MLPDSPVLASPAAAVVTVTLNRPEKRNALNVELLERLCSAIATADADPAGRILVLRGAGPVFCSGMDLTDAADPQRTPRSAELIESVLRQLATTRLVTIAAVQGAAFAGGAGLMSACDFVIATREARFGFPEVRRGLVPALVMTFLRRQLRERDARELLLLGKPIDADRALSIGLISRVAADSAALDAEVDALVSEILQGGPATITATKQLLRELWPSPFSADFGHAHDIHVAARGSAEAAEGIAAFHAKRPPTWATK